MTTLQIVINAPGQVRELAVPEERPGGVGNAFDQIPVVGNHHQGARPIIEQGFQLLKRVDVQIVRRLIQQQHIRFGHEHPGELQPAPLPTGQVLDGGALTFRAEPEAFCQLGGA